MVVQFNVFIPVEWVDIAAAFVVIVLAASLVYRLKRWSSVFPSRLLSDGMKYVKVSGLIKLFLFELGSRVLVQKDILSSSRSRKVVHLMTFWGFLGLGFATIWDDIFFRNGTLPPPGSSENFGNIVGNISGVVLLIGMTLIILRYALVERFKKYAKGDLAFLILLYLVTVTGFATELSRYSVNSFAIVNYSIHLAVIAALFVSAPFTHFFHAVLTPMMRYLERLQIVLAQKGITDYPFYRKLQMSNLASQVKDGTTPAIFPNWLDNEEPK